VTPAIEVAITRTIADAIQPEATRSYWNVPFWRNDRFLDHDSLLQKLFDMLFGDNPRHRIAITGLGGVGKTQIALELAYRVKIEYPDRSIFWIPGNSLDSFQNVYMEIGHLLRVPGLDQKGVDIRTHISQYLAKAKIGRWLMIVDSADDMDLWFGGRSNSAHSTPLIEFLPKSDEGILIFTTRNRHAAVKMAGNNVVEITSMEPDIARKLLERSVIHENTLDNEASVSTLLARLDFLPLGIAQAAAYMNAKAIRVSEYLSLVDGTEQEAFELLSEGFVEEREKTVAITWLVSFQQIRHNDQLAMDYLAFMCCFDPMNIPQSLLPSVASKVRHANALGTLSAYGFIERRQADGAFTLHRLVQLVGRNWMREEGTLKK
jgi:hypothetical protein